MATRLFLADQATLILTATRIWTGEETKPWAEAIAVEGERILADIVVLNRDPFSIPPAQLKDLQVLMTIVGGQVVYEKD